MTRRRIWFAAAALLAVAPLLAAEIKVDLSKEKVGAEPKTFQTVVGTWSVAEDGGEKVIKVDGTPWRAHLDNPTALLAQKARTFYNAASSEDFVDKVKQFAYYPVAVLTGVDNFTNGTISMKFKTVSGELDRCSGILFNVKPNGDWLSVRYNDTENNVAFWEFHNGVRRNIRFSDRSKPFPLDPAAWHELKMTVADTSFKAWLDGQLALEWTFGSMPGPGRNGAAPNPDLIPDNNPVLKPPIAGKIGLWSKTDSTSYFKDYVVSPAK
jgi:hypothetical protein